MSERIIRAAACLAFLVVAEVAKSSEGDQRYQTVIDQAVAAGVPGLQAHVREGEASWSGVAGLVSVEQRRAMARGDRIRLASLTKMMTAAVTLEFVRRGRFKLSDRIVTLLPAVVLDGVPYAEEITVGDLLEHRSGLHNFNGEDGADFGRDLFWDPERGQRLWTAAELLAYAKRPEHRPTNRPGEKQSYSSTGYIVLEMLLEDRSGQSLHRLLRDYLFAPLKMETAALEGGDATGAEIADSYARPSTGDRLAPSPFSGRKASRDDGLVNLSAGLGHYNAWARGAGAVAASVGDLAKFMDAVVAGRFEVMTDQAAQFARLREKPGKFFDWNGGSRGIQTTILYEPNRNITVIVLTNASNAGTSSHEVAKQLLDAVRGARDLGGHACSVLATAFCDRELSPPAMPKEIVEHTKVRRGRTPLPNRSFRLP
ncbi:N/A [soil metagenome]